ncbi:MAG: N-acetyltransferase [Bacteroidetes bacterium QS_7_67_15]|jgi:GNAT superfamily N-acetyltransferase|nr:MAG: N-acetyltransferase [Bacteroidetes bacterium QS_7_67_15]
MPRAPDANRTLKTENRPVRVVEIGLKRLGLIRALNREIFGEDHIINSFDREDLIMLLAEAREGGVPVGFKIGYRLSDRVFYSAKGGVHPDWRRRGIARLLLHDLMERAGRRDYDRFAYDTFPNKHPGMTVLGLDEGFRVTRAGYSARYEDYRLRFEKELSAVSH